MMPLALLVQGKVPHNDIQMFEAVCRPDIHGLVRNSPQMPRLGDEVYVWRFEFRVASCRRFKFAQGSPFEFPVWNLMHFPFESHNSLRDSILTPVKLSI
jgi:hypothetical protein